ncbi:MAG: electron transfer flavoprotein subunit beta/FixA family protein [Promethearchaeota archaeon]
MSPQTDSPEIYSGKAKDPADIILGIYDKHAIQAALQIKETKDEEVHITAVSLCSKFGEKILIEALAMGCDEVLRIDNEQAGILDPFNVAKVLSKAVEKFDHYDLLLFGMQGYHLGTATVPPIVAELLGLPCACRVEHIVFEDNKILVRKEIDNGTQTSRLSLPAVLSVTTACDYDERKYTSMKKLAAAKKRNIPVWTLEELKIDAERLKSTVEIEQVIVPKEKDTGCLVFKDEAVDVMVEKLVETLKSKGLNIPIDLGGE